MSFWGRSPPMCAATTRAFFAAHVRSICRLRTVNSWALICTAPSKPQRVCLIFLATCRAHSAAALASALSGRERKESNAAGTDRASALYTHL